MKDDQHGGVPAGATDLGVVCAKQGAVGLVTLDRPSLLNAITPAMCVEIGRSIKNWGSDPAVYAVVVRSAHPRVFSAGGDIRSAIEIACRDPAAARRDLRTEYTFNWQLDCFSKPMLALIDGLVMGSGVGVSHYGTHRVAGEGYAFAVPECALGLIPDVGQCWLLSRLPGHVGMYLALTGRRIGAADAMALELVTHVLPRPAVSEVVAGLADAYPIDPLLDERHVDPGPGDLAPLGALIEQCFSAATVEEILVRLGAVQGANAEAARAIAADIGRASPLALKITHRYLRMATGLDLRQTLIQDYRIVSRLAFGPDLAEGARAILIDKDRRPRWPHADLRAVSDAEVDRFFAPADDGDLALPSRAEMQTPAL